MALLIAGGLAVTTAVLVWFVVVPRLRAKILTLLNVIGSKLDLGFLDLGSS